MIQMFWSFSYFLFNFARLCLPLFTFVNTLFEWCIYAETLFLLLKRLIKRCVKFKTPKRFFQFILSYLKKKKNDEKICKKKVSYRCEILHVYGLNLMEKYFQWKSGKWPLMEEYFWWMTFDRRHPLMEDNLWWNKTIDGRQPLME